MKYRGFFPLLLTALLSPLLVLPSPPLLAAAAPPWDVPPPLPPQAVHASNRSTAIKTVKIFFMLRFLQISRTVFCGWGNHMVLAAF